MHRRSFLKSSVGLVALPTISQAAQAVSPYRRPKLKITEIRTAEVRVHGYQVHVRVYTDQGIIGQGESTDAAQGNVPLIRSFARLLIGQDPLNIDAAFERIRTAGVFAGAQSGQYVTAPIGMMATAHVCAAIPNFLVQEWHWIDSPDLWRNWVKEGEIIQQGYITPPDRAGLGVEMNDDGARNAQVPGTPWFEKT